MLGDNTLQKLLSKGWLRWEWFKVIDLGNGLVGLFNPASQRWLRVAVYRPSGDIVVDSVSQQDTFADWWKAEFFQLFDAGDGHVGLYNPLVQRWVGASPKREAVAKRSNPSPPTGKVGAQWEYFRLYTEPELKAVAAEQLARGRPVKIRLMNNYQAARCVTAILKPCHEYPRDQRNAISTRLIVHTGNWDKAMDASYALLWVFEPVEGHPMTFYIYVVDESISHESKRLYLAAHHRAKDVDKRNGNSSYACVHQPSDPHPEWRTRWKVVPVEGKPGVFNLQDCGGWGELQQGIFLAAHCGGKDHIQYPDYRNAGSSYMIVSISGARPYGGVYEGEFTFELAE